MLRITVHNDSGATFMKLEGKLASVWVEELRKCARGVLGTDTTTVVVDLSDVTFVDVAGKQLLDHLASDGVRLISADPAMDALVAEISKQFA